MIRATRLRNLPVVDLESAVKIGKVHELVLDPGRRRVAAVIVRRGRTMWGGANDAAVPGNAVQSVGADALTIRNIGPTHAQRGMELAAYPTLTSMIGRRVLSRRGKLLGSVADVLLDEATGRVTGYALDVRTGGRGIFGLARRGEDYWPDYVRADLDLRIGRHIIVAPDAALVQGEKIQPLPEIGDAEAPGWVERAPVAAPAIEAPRNKRPRRARPAIVAAPELGVPIQLVTAEAS
jgi:sporulation protein YlmC with PRC-barrel domain